MENLNGRIERILVEDCELSKEEISYMTKDEIFERILNYEGLLGYDRWIKRLVKDVYGVSLGNREPITEILDVEALQDFCTDNGIKAEISVSENGCAEIQTEDYWYGITKSMED